MNLSKIGTHALFAIDTSSPVERCRWMQEYITAAGYDVTVEADGHAMHIIGPDADAATEWWQGVKKSLVRGETNHEIRQLIEALIDRITR